MDKTGETHQGILDLSFFKLIPNITILAPKDFKELEDMMDFALQFKHPIVIRYPRGGEDNYTFNTHNPILLNKAEILREGKDLTILAIGNQVSKAMKIADELKKENIDSEVINVRFMKKFDQKTVLESINKTGFVITIEDNTLIGGLATEVKELLVENNLLNIKIKNYGYPDVFVEHGKVEQLEELYGLDEKTILNDIKSYLKNN